MNKIILALIIGNSFNLFITYLTATAKLADGRKKWVKQLTKKGWLFVICSVLYLIITMIQFSFIDKTTKTEQNTRDSVMTAKHDQSILNLKLSYDTSTTAIMLKANAIINKTDSNHFKIIKALAENNLQYNVKQDKIEDIVTHIAPISPTLICAGENGYIGFGSINRDNDYIFTFTSKGATSVNINLFTEIIFTDDFTKTNSFKKQKSSWWLQGGMIPENYFDSGTLKVKGPIPNYIIIWCKGNYQNLDKNKTFLFDEIFLYSSKENTSTVLVNETKENIRNWFISDKK